MEEVSMLLSKAIGAMNCGAVVLTKERRVRVVAGEAAQWLREYFEAPDELIHESLPEELEKWVFQQQKDLEGTARVVSRLLEVSRGERKLTVQFFRQQEGGMLLLEEKRTGEWRGALLNQFGLTKREAEVLYWVAQGKTNMEIAMILALSVRTVSKHLEHIYQKIGVETRTAAALVLAG